MAVSNKPSDDAKAMTEEYVKGVSIADIAAKYNHTEQEVEAVVTNPVEDTPTTLQSDTTESAPAVAADAKKGK